MREIDPHDAVDYILLNGKNFAKAKSERVYLEEYRKSLKALLMKRSMETAIGAQEREAYAHADYQAMLLGLRDATEAEEKLRWDLIGAQQRVEIWKTETYTNNKTDKLLR